MITLIKDALSLLLYIITLPFNRCKCAVLVYHSVERIDASYDPNKISVDPELFEQQMADLSKYRDRFVVSFDDGYENVYLNAFPILKKYGIRSILFLTTGHIDGKVSFDRFFSGRKAPKALTWGQVKEMSAAGIELGSHSATHRVMSGLDEGEAYNEALSSGKRIAEATGCNPLSFSYPFGNAGSFNGTTEDALKKAGYKRAYSNIMGMANGGDDNFEIRRIRIYPTDTIFRFRMKVAGAYNWVDLLAGFGGGGTISRPGKNVGY
ncbi:MAG: polysaccharide deacetylase family protein [Candidatus Omnitrophica bacterium]|nr:polysaccharide deacetylase family protein [Candidatus Omnitrophota bacterium]